MSDFSKKLAPVGRDAKSSTYGRRVAGNTDNMALTNAILKHIPREVAGQFDAIDLRANVLFLSTALGFKVKRRLDAVELMKALPPVRLVRVLYDRDAHKRGVTGMWPIRRRTDILPFIYTVAQGQAYGPIHTVSWVTKLGQYTVAILAHIDNDPARFKVVKNWDTPPGRMFIKYRYERNALFPEGESFGTYNRWSHEREPDEAQSTTFWLAHKYPNLSPTFLAATVLNPEREEGHHAEG
jgi:hypothetical protein